MNLLWHETGKLKGDETAVKRHSVSVCGAHGVIIRTIKHQSAQEGFCPTYFEPTAL